jgi:hypothetical protein
MSECDVFWHFGILLEIGYWKLEISSMALTKLTIPKGLQKKRALEPEDLRQAFLRAAKEKWGEDFPPEVKSVKNGVIRVVVPSAPWHSEIVWTRQEMVEKINASLGMDVIKKITVWWE